METAHLSDEEKLRLIWEVVEKELTAHRQDMCAQLKKLIPIKSIYDPSGTHAAELEEAAAACARLLRENDSDPSVRVIDMPDSPPDVKHPPLVYAHWPSDKPNAPTLLLYAHYDVVQATDEEFEPGENNGRITGRGSADDKSGIMMHVALCRALRTLRRSNLSVGVNIKLVLEGEEESGTDTLEKYVEAHPEMFRADVISLADAGNIAVGNPTLTTSLRGVLVADVEVRTLAKEVHSGVFGGPAPDAFMALTRILARLHDDDGNVAVPGLVGGQWQGTQPETTAFRENATVLDGVRLIGTGSLGSRLYTKPSISVVALDGPGRRTNYRNVLQAGATARVSVRLSPFENPQNAFTRLREHLQRPDLNPWGAIVEVTRVATATGFFAKTGTRGFRLAEWALNKIFPDKPVNHAGQGASIPPASSLQKLFPEAAILVWGCEEPSANIHARNESVDIGEMYAMTRAQALLTVLMGLWTGATVPPPRVEETLAPAMPIS